MRCKICKKFAKEGQYCANHTAARDSLIAGYRVWENAYHGMAWKDYLRRIEGLEETGHWVKEVISNEEGRDSN